MDNLLGYVADSETCIHDDFCLDECPTLEKSATFFNSAPSAETTTTMYTRPHPPGMICLSPSSLKDDGAGSIASAKVQNTFIHSLLPLPTPLGAGPRRRSLSMPKNVGSDKNAWEATGQARMRARLWPGRNQTCEFQQENMSNISDALPTPSVSEDMFPYYDTNQPASAPRCQPLSAGCMWPPSAVNPQLLLYTCGPAPYLASNFFLPQYSSSQSNVIHLASLLQ
jgi:hypothetical protein